MVLQSKLYPDEDDFTSEHDRIFLYLLEYWRDAVHELLNDADTKKWHIWEGNIIGEPRLDGYPPVFPDAIVSGSLYGMHTKGLDTYWFTTAEHLSVPVDANFQIKCEECSVKIDVAVSYPKFDFPDVEAWVRSKGLLDGPKQWWELRGSPERERIDAQYQECRANALQEWGRGRLAKMAEEHKVYVKSQREDLMKHRGPAFRIAFEIKPQIGSVGKVLRQLREYQMRIGQSAPQYFQFVILVTNDSRYDQAFRAQGFPVFHPPIDESAKGSGIE